MEALSAVGTVTFRALRPSPTTVEMVYENGGDDDAAIFTEQKQQHNARTVISTKSD